MPKSSHAALAAVAAIATLSLAAVADPALANPGLTTGTIENPGAAATPPAATAEPAKPGPDAAGQPATATDPAGTPPPAAAAPPPAPVDPIIAAVRDRLANAKDAKKSDKVDREGLTAYYATYTGAPHWVADGKLTSRAEAAIKEIRNADDWGLKASDFDLPAALPAPATNENLAEAEIDVGLAVLKYARHAKGGRVNPSRLTSMWDQEPALLEPKDVLKGITEASAADHYLRQLHPKHPQFERLRQALLAARAPAHPVAAHSGEDPSVTVPDGPRLKPGDKHAQVAVLRKRLGVTAETGQEEVFDQKLAEAVMDVQKANGINPTGVVSKTTRGALNGRKPDTGSDKVRRIIVNMERWRWMPAHLGETYVWDNIPEFMTRVMKDGKPIFTERIIVGTGKNPTPVFSADMQYIVFHPSWGVPDGIKSNEIGPALRKSSGDFFFFGSGASSVLKRHGLQVSQNGRPIDPDSVNWSNVDIRQFHFSQPPGSTNVLGVLKFMFPNKHDVYMHDTPQRELFAQGTRMFSHGCVRVQDPRRFAEILLGEDKGWGPGDISRMLAGSQQEVKLTKRIPVHITYFTALVDEHGKMQTLPDVYGHDSRISSALDGRPIQYVAASDASPEDAPVTTTKSAKGKKGKGPSAGETLLESLFSGGSF